MSAASEAQPTRQLRDVFGDDIILYDEGQESVVYRISAELMLNGQGYAMLEKATPGKEDEPEIFRVTAKADGELELETIDDDDEWENISELFDEWTFPADESM
ncbi:DUF1292 domain-containing protein [Paenibacillus mucilaginosus]|uniref:DUF1292 domain-containing protein n=3 Tax=Paenibacillus mucilaginosus TaxID=61624 RepID=H6NQB4_9BACL|nr:DUF1292 domain-containing protein [Paenibacillus mucilaginosus]AEI44892.1 hypothetical protein KNP414_06371 [Paenibacillus mucilaginosus KNP414]AFC32638.1 hypothetical protein PM3016_5983 [Paenibacillus mucilaginosus 3016]AFH64966.1 hypothetical protein B2K_30400 [Paenibacillus mucilaginosus K02]MCG7214934.1 DUF1292 domain-containing protein [Paenibacillus mucilaginosus]WDM26410.1 DUF1292 domain-containing protein [Paenibacillus mucilaginosus]